MIMLTCRHATALDVRAPERPPAQEPGLCSFGEAGRREARPGPDCLYARYWKNVRNTGRNSTQRLSFSFRLFAAEEGAVRGLRIILRILILAMVAGLGAGAWLISSQPQPREAERWSLGPSLLGPRGELAVAVGYARPCPTPPCVDRER